MPYSEFSGQHDPWLPPVVPATDGSFSAPSSLPDRSHVFGGEIAAQSVATAQAGHPGRSLETLSVHFLRPAAPDAPLIYRPRTLQAGRGYARVEVLTEQNGKTVCVSIVSLASDQAAQAAEDPADVVPPDFAAPAADLGTLPLLKATLSREDRLSIKITEITQDARWVGFRVQPDLAGACAPDPGVLAAYITDRLVLTAANEVAIKVDPARNLSQLTLNHTVTMHRLFDTARPVWMEVHAELIGPGRVQCRGLLRDATGARVASFAQAGLLTSKV